MLCLLCLFHLPDKHLFNLVVFLYPLFLESIYAGGHLLHLALLVLGRYIPLTDSTCSQKKTCVVLVQHELRRDKVSVPSRVMIWQKVLANRTGSAPFCSLGALLPRLLTLTGRVLDTGFFVEAW